MRMPFRAAHFVEHEITRDLEQPGRELRPRHIAAGAFPHPDENLLGNVFDIRIAPEHSRDGPRDECLMPSDELLERVSVAPRHQTHQADVFRIIPGARRCFWIGH